MSRNRGGAKSFTSDSSSLFGNGDHDKSYEKTPTRERINGSRNKNLYQVSIEDMTNMNPKDNWEIEGFKCPKSGQAKRRVQNIFMGKGKKSYLEGISKTFAAKTPPPGHYYSPAKWENRQGKFLKSKKRSLIEVNANIKNWVPGPGQYKPQTKERVPLCFSYKSPKTHNFLSESEYLGLSGPEPNKYTPNYAQTDKKTRQYAYTKLTAKDKEGWKFKKDPAPDVGSYNALTKWTKPRSRTTMLSKHVIPSYTDRASRITRDNPAVGKYDLVDTSKYYKPMRKYH